MVEPSSKTRTIVKDLASIAGYEHVSEAEHGISVAPANTQEAAAILRYANAESISVQPTGGGTKKTWGDPAKMQGEKPRAGIDLRTDRLNSVVDHTWQDMTCTVQAGCTWTGMQEALAKSSQSGQFVALDPLWPDRASIGGVVATNDSGTLRLKYGSLRDLVIGMTIVLADGTIAHSGGKVVKNVAGYDLHKLMIGAFGTLGLTTEVTFRLHSLPAAQESFSISSSTVEPLGLFLLKLIDSHLSLQSLQLRTVGSDFSLDIKLASFPQALEQHRKLLAAMAATAGLPLQAASAQVWDQRVQLFTPDVLTFKATLRPTEIPRFTGLVNELGGSAVTQATGIMTAALPISASAQIATLREQLAARGGSLNILNQPAGISLDQWGPMPRTWPLMQRLKRQFDPGGTLNPCCFSRWYLN